MRGCSLALAACLLVAGAAGDANSDPPAAPGKQALDLAQHSPGLAGTWLLTLPAGAKYEAVLRKVDDGHFRLEKAVRFSGTYELRDNRLALVQPLLSPADAGFAWELSAPGKLTLVAEPPSVRGQYLGASLQQKSKVVPPPAPPPQAAKGAAGGGARPEPRDPRPALDLAQHAPRLPGTWRLTLPAGAKYEAVLSRLDEGHFRLEKAVRFSGEYEVRGSRLVLVRAAQPPESGFVWELYAPDELVLVEQGPNLGSNYLGAVLKQQTSAAAAETKGGAAPPAPTQRPLFYLVIALAIAVVVLTAALVVVWLAVARRAAPRPGKRRPEEAPARSIPLTCGACGKAFKARAELAGKKVKCPQCSEAVLARLPSK